MVSITLKIAVDAPIPSASVSTAIAANPGVFPRFLTAYRISCTSVSMCTPISISTRFDRPPLQSTLLQSTPLQSTLTSAHLFPTNPVEAGATFSPLPQHLPGPVRAPALFRPFLWRGCACRPLSFFFFFSPPSTLALPLSQQTAPQ